MSRKVVLAVTLALLCAPVLVDLARSPKLRPFGYVAADTFYYLSVARNIARHGSFSFDGQHAVNGYHPLWQLMTAGIHRVTDAVGGSRYIVSWLVLVCLLLVALGVALLSRAFEGRDRRLTPLFALLPVGAFALSVAPVWFAREPHVATDNSMEGPMPIYGTLWSYVNGMESSVLLLCFGGAAYLYSRWRHAPQPRLASAFGLSLAMLTLARLDHVFIAVALLVAFVRLAWDAPETRSQATPALLGFVLPVAAYCAINALTFGSMMPVSGAMKTTLPNITSEHIQITIDLYRRKILNILVFHREAQLWVPLAAALVYLATTLVVRRVSGGFTIVLRRSGRDVDSFLVPVAMGVAGVCLYDLLFVFADAQGSWYTPVPVLFVSLALIALSQRIRWSLPARWAAVSLGIWCVMGLSLFIRMHYRPQYHERYAQFYWVDAPALKADGKPPLPRLVECDDGIVNYALDVPAMSNQLTLDPEAVDAWRGQRLLALAHERGFTGLATLVYVGAEQLLKDSSPEATRRHAQLLMRSDDLSEFDFTLDRITESGSFAILRAHKVRETP